MTTNTLFQPVTGNNTSGPANASTSGNWLLGVIFSPNPGMCWFQGYWLWAATGGDTTARKCALWNITATGTVQSLVPGSVVTSGTLTLNSWNFVALSSPIQIATSALYCAASGYVATNGVPVGSAQFGSGNTYGAGIVNGCLTGWSAATGTNTFPAATVNYGAGQMMFSQALGSDPSVNMPNNGSGNDHLGMDVQISTTPPGGYAGSYRLYPNKGDFGNYSLDTASNFTLGLEFSLTSACTINNVWFYSPPTVTQLPTSIGVFLVSSQTLVCSNLSPSWSGAAGSGWVKAALTGSLAASTNYKLGICNGAASPVQWNGAISGYWSTGGFGVNGLVAGPLVVPNNGSSSPSQASYNLGATLTYPNTTAGGGPGWEYGLDLEVTIAPPATGDDGLGANHILSGSVTRQGYGHETLIL